MASLALLMALALPVGAHAQDAAPASGGVFSRFELSLGVDGAGPALFRDTPDTRLEDTAVFQYGTRLAFRFGDRFVDDHRFGLALGVSSTARGASRKLMGFDTALLYATGNPFEVQFGLGSHVALGTEGFRENYSGVLSSLELRWSFLSEGAKTPLSVTPGLFGQFVLTPQDAAYSSAFAGARIELTWHKR